MTQLIKIQSQPDGSQRVSAREMYINLDYTSGQYSRWAKKHIKTNPYAVEGVDWVGLDMYVEGSMTTDYMLSVDFAKKLCMLSKTVVGEKIRNYFIEVERVALQHHANQLPNACKITEIEDKLRRLEAQVSPSDTSEFTVFGYARLCDKYICGTEAATLGKQASKQCRDQGLSISKIKDPRFGLVNTYPEHILYATFKEFFKRPRF